MLEKRHASTPKSSPAKVNWNAVRMVAESSKIPIFLATAIASLPRRKPAGNSNLVAPRSYHAAQHSVNI